jgi:hypothetical protein
VCSIGSGELGSIRVGMTMGETSEWRGEDGTKGSEEVSKGVGVNGSQTIGAEEVSSSGEEKGWSCIVKVQ